MLARLYAAWLLGSSLVRTIARRAFAPDSAGLALFRTNYAQDRLRPLSPAHHALQPKLSGCIACGLCDQSQSHAILASNGQFRGPMALVLSASRSIPDFDAATDALRHLDRASLRDLQDRCPVHLPFAELASFVETNADALVQRARRAHRPPAITPSGGEALGRLPHDGHPPHLFG